MRKSVPLFTTDEVFLRDKKLTGQFDRQTAQLVLLIAQLGFKVGQYGLFLGKFYVFTFVVREDFFVTVLIGTPVNDGHPFFRRGRLPGLLL